MYRVFNMGIGFCVIVPADASVVGQVEAAARAHGFDAQVIGQVIEDPAKRVFLPQHDLVGEGDAFTTPLSASRPQSPGTRPGSGLPARAAFPPDGVRMSS